MPDVDEMEALRREVEQAKKLAEETARRAGEDSKEIRSLIGESANATNQELLRIERKVDRLLKLLDGADDNLEIGLRWRIARHEERIREMEKGLEARQEISKVTVIAAATISAAVVTGVFQLVVAALHGKMP